MQKVVYKKQIPNSSKPVSKWVTHVQKYAKDNNLSYWEALKSPDCKKSYKK
jgi:hypothetical protein